MGRKDIHEITEINNKIGEVADPIDTPSVMGRILKIIGDVGNILNVSLGTTSDSNTKQTVHGKIGAVKSDVADVKTDVGSVKTDVGSVKSLLGTVTDALGTNTVFAWLKTINTNVNAIMTTWTVTKAGYLDVAISTLNANIVNTYNLVNSKASPPRTVYAGTTVRANFNNLNTPAGGVARTSMRMAVTGVVLVKIVVTGLGQATGWVNKNEPSDILAGMPQSALGTGALNTTIATGTLAVNTTNYALCPVTAGDILTVKTNAGGAFSTSSIQLIYDYDPTEVLLT